MDIWQVTAFAVALSISIHLIFELQGIALYINGLFVGIPFLSPCKQPWSSQPWIKIFG